MIKSYCTQNNGDCSTCSLVNYNRDCLNNPIHGGYRANSGRKPSDDPRRPRSIKFTDAEWDWLKQEAGRQGISVSEYIRNRVL